MKTYNEFLTKPLTEGTMAEDHRSDVTKLGTALIEAEKLHKRIDELANKLYKETGKYSGPSNSKLSAILGMCSKPDEVAKNGSLLKQRLEQHASGVEKK